MSLKGYHPSLIEPVEGCLRGVEGPTGCLWLAVGPSTRADNQKPLQVNLDGPLNIGHKVVRGYYV